MLVGEEEEPRPRLLVFACARRRRRRGRRRSKWHGFLSGDLTRALLDNPPRPRCGAPPNNGATAPTGGRVTTVIPNGLHRIRLGEGLQAHVETRLVSSPARPRRSRSSTSSPRRLGGWWGATARHSRRRACSPPLSVMVDCCCVQGTPGVVPFVPFVPVCRRHRLSADYDKGGALDQNRLSWGLL